MRSTLVTLSTRADLRFLQALSRTAPRTTLAPTKRRPLYPTWSMAKSPYDDWSPEQLKARIAELEASMGIGSAAEGKSKAEEKPAAPAPAAAAMPNGSTEQNNRELLRSKKNGKPVKQPRPFDMSTQPIRKIALRFAYEGSPYSGLAVQSHGGSSLPTVEAVLWSALCESRLVDPEKGLEGAGWSRCGRTDRGVSAAGQVVSLWVRSKTVDEREKRRLYEEQLEARRAAAKAAGKLVRCEDEVISDLEEDDAAAEEAELAVEAEAALAATEAAATSDAAAPPANGTADADESSDAAPRVKELDPNGPELPYLHALNRVLPPSIRVLAWSPVSPNFNARFSCRYRHYKYFFTEGPPFSTGADETARGSERGSPKLDIAAMRDAAARLLGEHDFRNMCRVDASKQVDNFRRRIDGVSIDEVPRAWAGNCAEPEGLGGQDERMFVLNLRGTAFLYHQVRCIMAILFLVGSKLEKPEIVDELVNVSAGAVAADVRWLRERGVPNRIAANTLPGSTATERDGAVAQTTRRAGPQLASFVAGENVETRSAAEVEAELEHLSSLRVYDAKPTYEMASDGPLVLWDCGFRPSDVQWRSGLYAGSLPPPSDAKVDLDSASQNITTQLHAEWTKSQVTSQIWRHFLFSTPAPGLGTQEAGTTYAETRWPHFAAPARTEESLARVTMAQARNYGQIALGGGQTRPTYQWTGLAARRREDTAEEKNARWLEGAGKRRADKRGITPLQLAKGMRAG